MSTRSVWLVTAMVLRLGLAVGPLSGMPPSRPTSVNPQEREAAAWDLGVGAEPGSVPALLKLLSDPDPGVRSTAAWALLETEAPEARRAVHALIFDKDEALARFAVRSLELKYDAGAQDLLARAARRHPSTEVRARALALLDQNFVPELLPAFQAVAESDDTLLVLKALPILVRRKLLAEGDDLVPVFVKCLSRPEAEARLLAVQGLRGVDDERVAELLEQAVADKDPKVHDAALGAYAALVDRRSLRGLERMYAAASPRDRATILSGVPVAKVDLMRGLFPRAQADPAPEPRRALVHLMRFRRYPDPDFTRPFLESGARDADVGVRRVAAGGLASLPAPPLALLADAVRDKAAEVRAEVVEVLAEREDAAGADILIAALADPMAEIRVKAVDGVSRVVSGEAAMAALGPLTRDASPMVRAAAVRAVGRGAAYAKARGAQETALLALKDSAPEVRAAAAEALRQMHKGDWVATIATLLDDPSPLVRQASFEQIKLEDKKVRPYLIKALADPDVGVRRLAVAACSPLKKLEPSLVTRLLARWEDKTEDYLVRASAERVLEDLKALPVGYTSVTDWYAANGSLPAPFARLFVFPGTLPGDAAGPPNLKLLGRYEAVDPRTTPEAFHVMVIEKDASGRIFYTSWGQRAEAVVTDRFQAEPEVPGMKALCFWGKDGAYTVLTWARSKASEQKGAITIALDDAGDTLTYTQEWEMRPRGSGPVQFSRNRHTFRRVRP